MKNKMRIRYKLSLILLTLTLLVYLMPSNLASLGTFKQNECLEIKTILNTSAVNISTISYPNSIIAISNQAMTKQGFTFNYTFCNTSLLGNYIYDYFDSEGVVYVNDFTISPNGSEFTIQQALIFIVLFAFFLLILIGGIYGMQRAASGAWTIAYICLSYISLFCIFFIAWLFSSDYLWATPILTSIFWILWFTMAIGFLPFLIIISVYIIGKGVKENLIKEYTSQGFTREEAKGLIKRGRR